MDSQVHTDGCHVPRPGALKDGNTASYAYDPNGLLVETVDAAGGQPPYEDYVTRTVYDRLHRPVTVELPSDAAERAAGDGPAFVHSFYDAGGRVDCRSQPTLEPDRHTAGMDLEALTRADYFDAGWVRTAAYPGLPRVRLRYDYTAQGWQSARVPVDPDTLDPLDGEAMSWAWLDDGLLAERADQQGGRATFAYDANGMLVDASDATGLVAGAPVEVAAGYDSLGRPVRVRHRDRDDGDPDAGWRVSTQTFDPDGNTVERLDDADWDPLAEAPVTGSGRPHEFTYTPAGWLAAHVDHGDAATPAQRTTTTFDAAGREVERVTAQGAGWGDTVQETTWDWLPGGLLERLETRTGTGALVSSHDVSYIDAAGVFVNGHRVAETFRRDSPEQTTACRDTDCVAAYTFDARERLTAEHVTVAATAATVTDVTYTLDVAGNVVEQTDAGQTTGFEYFGDQLQWVDPPDGPRQHHHHDPRGNLACVTLTGQPADCDGIATGSDLPQGVLAAYAWDPFDRLQAYRSFTQDPAGVAEPEADSHATYTYDPLDRVRSQTESHDGDDTAAKTSVFAYLGLTAQVVTEQQTHTATGAAVTTKTYRHDAHGRVTGMVNTPDDPQRGGPAGVFTYGFDVHGSVSTLLDEHGDVHAAYGYSPYGADREQLSAGDTDPHDPLNPHRYTAKRLDTGTGSLDMGARRFGPDAGRFLSRDRYLGALADLGLTFDPLTGNRYALAAGNPISFVEHDGRTVIPNGAGGASPHASPAATATISGCNVSQLDCTLEDVEAMTIHARLTWTSEFQTHWGEEYNFEGQLAPIEAVLEFAMSEPRVASDPWFSQVNAAILHGVQEGLATVHFDGRTSDHPGASHWADFVRYRSGEEELSQRESRRLWGVAEQVSTDHGFATARNVRAGLGLRTFGQVTDIYRRAHISQDPAEVGRFGAQRMRAVCPPAIGRWCAVAGAVGGAAAGSASRHGLLDPERDSELIRAGAPLVYQASRVLEWARR